MITVEVVKRGVTPELTLIFGVIVPDTSKMPAPDEAVPMLKCVSVAVRPVQAGASMFATGDTELAVTVQPPDVRATATRAYDV